MQEAVLHRGDWSLCAMEHSLIGPVRIDDPGMPFHHLMLPLGATPLRLGLEAEGRTRCARTECDLVGVIEAGVGGISWWDGPLESACFYFMPGALEVALGDDHAMTHHAIRSTPGATSEIVARLLRALWADAIHGQPHGRLAGDSIFPVLASHLVPGSNQRPPRTRGPGWRVRRALSYIHAHLVGTLNLSAIADAAATSPYHLGREFRAVMGLSIWQYVIRARARHALALMKNPALTLADVAHASGFETYAGFIDSLRREYGLAPSRLRRAVMH